MKIKQIVAIVIFVGLGFSGAAAAAENERDAARLADAAIRTLPAAPISAFVPKVKRPSALPALYVTLGVMQAWDIYSTRTALKAGAHEANPTAAAFAGNTGSLIGLKVATTASTIFFAERMWKKNKVGAVVLMAAINGATAMVSMHNMRNARIAASRR